jgi:hypothetical protein
MRKMMSQQLEESSQDLDPEFQQDSQPDSEIDQNEETQAGSDTDEPARGFEFSHPALKGKSPEEIERLVSFTDQIVRNQQEKLRSLQSAPKPSAPEEPAPEEISSDEFWNNPGTNVHRIVRQVLKEEIEPFKRDLSYSQRAQARSSLRQEFNDFDSMEPYIDKIIETNNFPNPNDPGLLRTLYFTAKGMAASGAPGMTTSTSKESTKSENSSRQPRPAPPQHRPSGAPLPAEAGSKKKVSLSEEEKRLAREWGMSGEEFVALRDANPDEFMRREDG